MAQEIITYWDLIAHLLTHEQYIKHFKEFEYFLTFFKSILQGLRVAQAAVTERWP